MKKLRIKYLALALVVALSLTVTGALANLTVIKSPTNITVDGRAITPDAYLINDSNYFKLRDIAKELDFGVSYNAATNTGSIDSKAHYKPDPTKLITGNWASATRTRIQAVIDANANKGRYVVFDFDNTSVIFDVQEALLIYQIENLIFRITPDKMQGVLETGIPELTRAIGKNAAGRDILVSDVVADLVADYTWIYANYKGMSGDKGLDLIHASNEYQDFSAKLRFMYNNLGDYFDHAVSYPWVTYLFAGMTPAEVQEMATASHKYWASYGRYANETWTSPLELPGKAGVVSAGFITGVTFTDELIDLYHTIAANKIDIYIVSASPQDTIVAASKAMGYGVPEDRIFAMRNKLDASGRYINDYNYDWGGTGKYAQTQGPGKSTIIKNFIAPKYKNVGPLMVFGDSAGDMNMMNDWMGGDCQLGVLFNRYRKPGSDPLTWEASVKASETIGKADAKYVLQGRDENSGQLRPTEKSIMIGTDKEVLVRPAA